MDFLESTWRKLGAAAVVLVLLFSLGFVAQNAAEGSFIDSGATVQGSTSSASMSPAGSDTSSSGFFQGTLISGQEGCFDSNYENCYQSSNEYNRASVEALIQSGNPDTITKKDGVWLVEQGESVDYECGEPEPLGSMYHDTYLFYQSPSFTWDSNGDGTPDYNSPRPAGDYRELDSNKGSFEIDWTQAKKIQIVCVAYDQHWSGDWVWQYQSVYWDSPYKVASDSDNDGVYDYKDDCPQTSGTQGTSGCPDTDGDGVKDSQDAFPNDADCEVDTDGDGVCDSKDVAPNDPSIQYDSDQDGIDDSNDDCPEIEGVQAKNGCPNEPSEIVSVDGSQNVTVGESVEFSVSVNNPDGDSQSISWSNGDTGTTATYSFDSQGSKTVSVTVKDGFTESTETVNVEVSSAPEPPSPLNALSSFFSNLWSIVTFSG